MRGHFLSGTRKLNRHYQSGSGWKLIADSTKNWVTEQKVLNDGAITGYIPVDGIGSGLKYKIPLRVGSRFKIVSDIPLYHLEYGSPEHASQTHGITIGFAKLEYKLNGTEYYIEGLSNYDALYPAPRPFYRGIVFYRDSMLNEPMFRIRYYCDETYRTVYMELDKIWDGYTDLRCYSNFAILSYKGSGVWAYLNYFSETELEKYRLKMYRWE